LLPYKRVDLAIAAAALAGVRLFVAGTGPAEAALRRQARGTTTTILGYVDDPRMNALLGDARAAIVPGEEDFGLVPLEAAACGRPTIAFRSGGALETIVDGVTGTFFEGATAESLAEALRTFDPARFDTAVLRAHAEAFAPPRFIERLRAIVARVRDEVLTPV
jgi:glycosyltransferase involved in cell wall biosynthesis